MSAVEATKQLQQLQVALQEKEECLRLLVSCVRGYEICTLDKNGCVVSWNANADNGKGYGADEVVNRHFSIFYAAEDIASGLPERELAAARDNGFFEAEGWRIHKDGSRFLAHIAITPLTDAVGVVSGYAKVTRDISTHKQFEERFRLVVESAPNAMVMTDPSGRIEMVNTQAELVFGYERTEMLGQPVEILVPERFRGHHPALRTEFFHAPQSRPMGAGRDLFGRRKNGTEFPIEIGLNPIETDQGIRVLSSIVDISTRKRLEERFRQVVESAPNAMVMTDPDGRIEMVNTQAELVFGYTREEMLGQPVEILVPERFRGHHPKLRTEFFQAPQSRPMGAGRDLFGRRKNGSEFPIEIGLNPIETDEGTMVLSAIVDISDRKQKEQKIEAALEEKNILLGEIHHRVKNNLQVVHSLLDLQSSRIDDPTLLSVLRDSQNRVRAMALIHQTLYQSKDFARIDFSDVLNSLVPSLIESYGIEQAKIVYTLNVEPIFLSINAAIPCGLIVNEVISNALKHAFPPGGSGTIAVRLALQDGKVFLSVSDDGVGIHEDLDLEKSETLGLQLVSLLAGQLNAELSIRRSKPTQFALLFTPDR